MVHHIPKKPLYLLAALTPSVLAGKDAPVTKDFKFTEDVHIKFDPLNTAIGPEQKDLLLDSLNGPFAEEFKAAWIAQIEADLQDGGCTVNAMTLPKFSICNWRYPDLYNVDELPLPGQCYEYENGFIQRVYYKIKRLEITCPDNFKYKDLDQNSYVEAAFANNAFLDIIQPTNTEGVVPFEEDCDAEEDPACLFVPAEVAEPSSCDQCTAELFINRYVDIPLVLQCLEEPYGKETADQIILALDSFFESEVEPVLTQKIYEESPESFVYNFVSPFEAEDRQYCVHGQYYEGGNLVDQQVGEDGITVTKFVCGFDVIWYKPITGANGDLFEDEDISSIVSGIFEDADFLGFLLENYTDLVQGVESCGIIDPLRAITFSPTKRPTTSPSNKPSSSPIISTSDPTGSPTTNTPTASPSLGPTTSSIPTAFIEPSSSPSQSSHPSDTPTLAPTTSLPTTGSTAAAGSGQTLLPTPFPSDAVVPVTPSPTCPNCLVTPDISLDEKPLVTSGTCGGGDRGDGECPTEGYCCSQWGYCGVTDEYCSSDVAPTPSSVEGAPQAPTIQIDAGTCGSGGGDEGDGFCPLDNAPCCSQESPRLCCFVVCSSVQYEVSYGYCGDGEQYCFVTKSIDVDSESDNGGTCGGGGVGNGLCKDETLCCSQFGFCGTGELYCTGVNSDIVDDVDESVVERSPLPASLQPEFGFRCGVTEVDARSNCKSQCTHHIQCADGEECWGVQLNYCNTFEEGEHPICTDLDLADNDSRCGFDEASARGYCGNKCGSDDECGEGEFCFPTLLNLCECHLDDTKPDESEENTIVFSQAKALISPYFVQSEPMSSNSNVEGKPRNGSSGKSTLSALSVLLLVGGVMML